ncbi:MAG: leucine-rich repeat domain-containing protein [Muribaculaceae bacterium]|nr:leucine-rich repeat domain-containing protein [Muribaculaceae bacterium]
MKLKLYIIIAVSLICSEFLSATVLKTTPFLLEEEECSYFPAGFVSKDSGAAVYQLNNCEDTDYLGHFLGNYATMLRLLRGDETTINYFWVNDYVTIGNKFLPVATLNGTFENSLISIICMSDQIARIERNTFLNAKRLTSLTLPVSLNFLGIRSLDGLDNIQTLTFRSPTPPVLELGSESLKENKSNSENLNLSLYNYLTPFGRAVIPENVKVEVPRGTQYWYKTYSLYPDFIQDFEEYDPQWQFLNNPNCSDDFLFAKSANQTVELITYSGSEKDFRIPDSLHSEDISMGLSMIENNWVVRGLGVNACNGNRYIRSVEIPDNVNYLKDGAFSNCDLLRKVTLSGDVKFVGKSFQNLIHLEKFVILPPEVTSSNDLLIWNEDDFENLNPDAVLVYSPNDTRIDVNNKPFNKFHKFEFLNSGIDEICKDREFENSIFVDNNGISIKNNSDNKIVISIISVDGGVIVSNIQVSANEKYSIFLGNGVYIIKIGEKTFKTVIST